MPLYERFDALSSLRLPEVSVTGTITLDASAFGRMHVISGTSADYSITLPAVSGNADKFVGFRVAPVASASKIYSLDGNSTETIDEALTLPLWANESVFLLCNGSAWVQVAGKSIPHQCRLTLTSNQSIANNTVTAVNFTTEGFDNAGLHDTATNTERITIRRTGRYMIGGSARWTSNASGSRFCAINLNGGAGTADLVRDRKLPSTESEVSLTTLVSLTAGDFIQLNVYQDSGGALNAIAGEFTSLWASEQPVW